MKQNASRIVVALILACLLLSACQQGVPPSTAGEARAVKVEHLTTGQSPTRETLTEDAAKRIDIQTATVRDTEVKGALRKVIPYAAILYDTQGATWVYTNPEPLIFFRNPIKVDYIAGDDAFLLEGPPTGTAVVTIGGAELYGAEVEFEEE